MKRHILIVLGIYFSGCASHTRIVDRYATNAKKTAEIVKGKGDDAKVTKRITYFGNGRIQSELLINNGRPNGKAIFYHPNGSIAAKGKYVNGLESGKWVWTNTSGAIDSTHSFKYGKLDGKTSYSINGEKTLIQSYVDGNRHGDFKEFYPGGNKKVVGEYANNLPHEKWTWYHTDKSKSRSVSFSHGVKHGEFKIWNNGELVLTGQFTADQRTGTWKWGSSKKELDSLATYSAGNLHGEFKAWHANGESAIEGQYIEGEPNGQWEWWSEDGMLDSSKTFMSGQLNGLSQFYFKNGQLNSSVNYELGELDGETSSYFASGAIRSITTYKSGEKTGPYEIWYGADRPEEKGNYTENKPHGPMQRWYSNGGVASVANYDKGILEGLTQIFTLSGQIKKELFYDEGSEIARIEYHDNGRFKRVLILSGGDIQYERKWNQLGVEETNEAYVLGTHLDTEFYLTGFLKYECIYKDDKKHGMEWWFNSDNNPTQVNLYLNGREVISHEIAYETTE